MENLGFSELMLILVVCMLVFGAKRLPEIGSSIGKGIREFKRGLSDAGDSLPGTSNDDRSPAVHQVEAGPASLGGDPKRLSQ
jgi:sec-independent protein translocase protein TatA